MSLLAPRFARASHQPDDGGSSKSLDPSHALFPTTLQDLSLPPNLNKANLLNPNNPNYDPEIARRVRMMEKVSRGRQNTHIQTHAHSHARHL